MTLDLSAVTDSLIGLVKSQWTTAPMWAEIGGNPAGPTFTPNFTGLAPDAARTQPGTQLSMYLYHVESDNAQETLFWQDQILRAAAGEPTRFLPLALNLFYLLFAYSEASYTEEQEAMSVALRIYHANPIVRSDPGAANPWELTLTMEHRSYDELSRLWQATTVPLRMSLVYRAAVVFIDPDPTPPPAPKPRYYTVVADPAELPVGEDPVVFGTFRDGSYMGPTGSAASLWLSPATVAASQTLWLTGSHLDSAGHSDRVLPPATGRQCRGGRHDMGGGRRLHRRQVRAHPAADGRDRAGRNSGTGRLPAPRRKRSGGYPRRHADRIDPRQHRCLCEPRGRPGAGWSAPLHRLRCGFHPGSNAGPGRHGGADGHRGRPSSR